ncbi:globin-coupled sensor protein [Stappia sp.]|uniref:globin-coupled sensor protein n=1 Tax=Stappia sp. TaxID=1870903 RepID=UPI0032D91CBD
MGKSNKIAERCAFYGVEGDTLSCLRKAKPLLMRVMPAILDDFYRHIARFPETKAFFTSPGHMTHARDMQLRHWDIISDGRFDEAYVASVTKVGEAHNRLGLEPRWYIGGYNYLVAGLMSAIRAECDGGLLRRGRGGRMDAMQRAVLAAAMLDMDLAISVYIEAGRRDRRETLERLAGEFEQAVSTIVGTCVEAAHALDVASGDLTTVAGETTGQARQVQSVSLDASQNVQAVASAAEELSASIQEIARQVSEATRISDLAVENAGRSTEKIGSLTSASQKIGDIVRLISDIAEQTNLLALNATIEAARAGEAGRGFAVVAAEVKELATQTAKATAEIAAQIGEIQTATSESAEAIDSVSTTIRSMNDISTAIAAAVEEQGAATGEISRNIALASEGTGRVTDVADGITGATERSKAAAETVRTQSSALKGHIGDLSARMRDLVETVRAA